MRGPRGFMGRPGVEVSHGSPVCVCVCVWSLYVAVCHSTWVFRITRRLINFALLMSRTSGVLIRLLLLSCVPHRAEMLPTHIFRQQGDDMNEVISSMA